ncbi:MAG: SDR family oxidoreductase [Opitutales bacterium]|nr:SDR family oxidoreductase [Opitutales bacterium]MCH8540955.1 SDR family oxidoreductase [Opitutales bacterium]
MSSKAKTILITGASQGIGAAIAREFSQHPAVKLALVARNHDNLKKVQKEVEKNGAAAEVFPCDVAQPGAVEELARSVTSSLGTPDILINNAGCFVPNSFLEFSFEDFESLYAANLRSVFLVTKAFLPKMVKRKSGQIFNMGSIAGLAGYPGGTGYCAAKFGVTGLTRVLREEMKEHGIKVTLIAPGPTFSPSWEGSGVPEDRMMPAEDIARVVYQASILHGRTVMEEVILNPQLGPL